MNQTLLARDSLEAERVAAVRLLLARGALTPYRPNLALAVLAWVGAIVFVGFALAVSVWLL
jgi:hypothetical protein